MPRRSLTRCGKEFYNRRVWLKLAVPDSLSGRSPYRYPLRRVAGWQLIATGIIAAAGSIGWGWHGAISGVLGGVTNMAAGAAYAFLVGLANPSSAAGTLVTAFRAEAVKVVLIVIQLWLVLTMYPDVVHAVFFAAFVVTVLVTQAAILIRD
jgi:ATP synthase protein I